MGRKLETLCSQIGRLQLFGLLNNAFYLVGAFAFKETTMVYRKHNTQHIKFTVDREIYCTRHAYFHFR